MPTIDERVHGYEPAAWQLKTLREKIEALEAENRSLREILLIEQSCNRCDQYHGKEPCADVPELQSRIEAGLKLADEWHRDEMKQPDLGIGSNQQPIRCGIACADELREALGDG